MYNDVWHRINCPTQQVAKPVGFSGMIHWFRLESRGLVLAVAVTMFMVQLDATMLVVALPVISSEFRVPTMSLSLAITIYLTMMVALLPASGWAADRFGARRVFVCAIVGFALASLLCALCDSLWLLVTARALQGAAASMLVPIARLILLKRTARHELVDALSIMAMPMLVAPTVGPILGGLIVQFTRWELIFLLNLPVAVLLLWLTRAHVPPLSPDPTKRLDWRGALLFAGALITGTTGLDRLTANPERPLAWLLVACGAAIAAMTWRHLRRHPHPIVSLDALRHPTFATTALGAGALVRVPARALLFITPLMLQMAFGLSPFAAGLALMALSGGDLVTKPVIRPLFDRFGFYRTMIWSSLAGSMTLVALAMLPRSSMLVPALLVVLLVSGISRSVLFTGISVQSFSALDDEQMSSGNVVISVSQQFMNMATVLLSTMLLALLAQTAGKLEPGLLEFRLALVVIAIVGALATVRLRRHLPHHLDASKADGLRTLANR